LPCGDGHSRHTRAHTMSNARVALYTPVLPFLRRLGTCAAPSPIVRGVLLMYVPVLSVFRIFHCCPLRWYLRRKGEQEDETSRVPSLCL
jgi:hypothetical protein